MNSLSDASAALRRPPWWAFGLALSIAVVAALLWLVLAEPQRSQQGQVLLTLLLSSVLVVLMTAVGWHVGVRLTRQRYAEALREARIHAQALVHLQPDWQWQTDAQHHLVRWQAPLGAPASSWVGATATQSLWERFELPELGSGSSGASLRQRLDEQAPFGELEVAGQIDGGAAAQFSGRWLLRAQVCLDASGRFCGYLGTARQVPAQQPSRLDWLRAMPGPALLVEANEAPRLVDLNSAAAEWLGQRESAVRGGAWIDAQRGLDAQAKEALRKGEGQVGDWVFGWRVLSPGLRLLTLWPLPAGSLAGQAAMEAAEAARADHEAFSYTVSHDLRAPLRVVEGFSRILKEDYGRALDRIGTDHLDRVMGAAARMNSMIDSLLSLSALSSQPLSRQPVNLSQVASFVCEDLRRSAPEREVALTIAPDMSVHGDPTLLRMVLENLLGNAWKYSGKCEKAEVRFETVIDQGQRVFVVADNGAGFDMRFADRLFGVFQRLHSASDFQGTGVGLASVRRIVRRHGGEIWAESEVGRGARFYFTLAD
ncbi:ATP-binding protein [Paucibacter sp. JuS9]|uniref:sensor histidine kinase n=1 Tax=Paucibacter sp. JuS9 TaxID=3228748 RepID=UPI00375813D3